MKLLSEKSAIKHYENLYIIHNLNLTLALKVCIFWHILEHEILKEATKLQKYYDKPGQLDWLKKNKENLDRNGEKIGTGFIPREIILDIENIRGYRNLAEHTGKMDDINYKKHFRTMAVTINLLSEIQIPERIINILKRIITIKIKRPEEIDIKRDFGSNKSLRIINKKPIENRTLGKKESIEIINEKLSLDISKYNTIYSSINKNISQWAFNTNNLMFKNDINIILEDQENKIIYYFSVKSGTIKEPEKIFNQRNDRYVKDYSIIIIPTNDKNFTNKYNGKEFQFIKYLIKEIKY